MYETDFRPVMLNEQVKLGREIYDAKDMRAVSTITYTDLSNIRNDSIYLTLKYLIQGHSILVFYNNKEKLEELARVIRLKIE